MKDEDGLSEEDKALFRAAAKGTSPLRETARDNSKKATVAVVAKQSRQGTHSSRSSFNIHLSNYYTDPVLSESILSFTRAGLKSRQLKELSSGKLSWEAKLDLHGCKTEQAGTLLLEFLNTQYENGARCVLIIHGKGGRFGEEPILKNLVNHWLPQLPVVLAFRSAIPKDGGAGAVYVLLKRLRSQ